MNKYLPTFDRYTTPGIRNVPANPVQESEAASRDYTPHRGVKKADAIADLPKVEQWRQREQTTRCSAAEDEK